MGSDDGDAARQVRPVRLIAFVSGLWAGIMIVMIIAQRFAPARADREPLYLTSWESGVAPWFLALFGVLVVCSVLVILRIRHARVGVLLAIGIYVVWSVY